MSNDPFQFARQVVGRDPVALRLGLEVLEVEQARALIGLTAGPDHLNALGRVHGTTYYALVDQAVAVAANTLAGTALVVECKVNFLGKAQAGERLKAQARALNLGRTLGLWEARVTGPGDRLLAVGQAMTFHRPLKTPPSEQASS